MHKADIFKFLLLSTSVYLFLVFAGSIDQINNAVGEIFRNINNAHFNGLMENTSVKFFEARNSAFDTVIHIKYTNESHWNFAEFKLDSWYTFYIPNVLFIALVLATRFGSFQKKLVAFLAGIVLTNLLSYTILLVRVCTLSIQVKSTLGDFNNTFSDRMVIFFHNNFAVYGWITFLTPIFAWLIVAFKGISLQTGLQLTHATTEAKKKKPASQL